MAEEINAAMKATAAETTLSNKKRKLMQRGGKGKKKPPNKKYKKLKPVERPKKPDSKMIKLYKKRAEAYNSDDDEEDEKEGIEGRYDEEGEERPLNDEDDDGNDDEEDDGDLPDEISGSDEDEMDGDGHGAHSGITKFVEGCRSFQKAFSKIMEKHLPNDPLGPISSGHKKIVAEKLLEEEIEHKSKGKARKEKHLAIEKGHVKPESYLDTKEKLLISIATKGVVKLFNAVNKAQNPQKGLNPSKSKDAKELSKRRKQTFLSEIKKSATETPDNSSLFNFSKYGKSENTVEGSEPHWAPLRDSYMLSNSKSKGWDKMPDPSATVDQGTGILGSSSDEG